MWEFIGGGLLGLLAILAWWANRALNQLCKDINYLMDDSFPTHTLTVSYKKEPQAKLKR